MSKIYSSSVSLYLAGILAAIVLLGLIYFVPGLIAGVSTLLLVGIVALVIVIVLFAVAIILRGLSRLLASLRL
ncbi:hypothetical protein [Sporosarcina pasteurii]|uniref:Uncharacterized protein n=1 Tax=Sporosarcina pasteurii TaxID=1474 RepID=A0A380BED8_SPOPA|nr:hypothetical protein [Sporosarcina pasteurii]MDS9472531.1 hypothetical protein [Sporosarcina pasteurii]QBQ06085.1 hypothetical protein E2C16_10575 [Sporosarcina pasteurii]SUI99487.1 Uncharacterised protein [Sporosarcina pasteurii]